MYMELQGLTLKDTVTIFFIMTSVPISTSANDICQRTLGDVFFGAGGGGVVHRSKILK